MSRKANQYLDAERCAIMERIEERCSTNISPKADARGRSDDFVTVYAYPFQVGMPCAQFTWSTADHITKTTLRFNL